MSNLKAKGYVRPEDLHHTYGPSTLPKLAKCIHFVGKSGSSEAMSRGTLLHEQIAQTLDFSGGPENAPFCDPEAKRGVERLHKLLDEIKGVEQLFSLINDNLEELTFGTVDAWGYGDDGEDRILTVVDFKSGSLSAGPEAYLEQLAAYALMVMDHEMKDECRVAIIPLDSEDIDFHLTRFTYEEAQNIVLPIFERISKGEESPQENNACPWCRKRETCPVWQLPANSALTLVEALPEVISRQWIEASPQNAGLALSAFKKLEGIFDDLGVKDRIKEALQSGEEVPGWKLQTRKGAERLDAKAIKARWSELTSDPLPATIGEDSVSLVAERRSK